jgi:hypothetical protein
MKTFSNEVRTEFYRENFIAVDLVELHLTTPVYLASGGINIAFNSDTAPTAGTNSYTAQGDFLGFSTLNEDFDVRVGKFTIYLSAVGNSYVNKFVDRDYEGRRVVVYKAFLNYSNLSIVGTPIMIFDGQIYNAAITEKSNSCQINVECSSLFADFERTAGRKTNTNSNWFYQGVEYDTSMDKSGIVGQSEFKWGRL